MIKSKSFLLSMIATGALMVAPFAAALADPAEQSVDITAPSTLAVNDADAGARGGHSWHHDGFELSDDQLERLNAIKMQFAKNTAGMRADLHVQKMQLKDILTKPQIDVGQAKSVQDRINSLHAQLSDARLNYVIERAAVFTPEQRQQMRRMFLRHGAFGGHHHPGGGACGGGGCGGHMKGGGHHGGGRWSAERPQQEQAPTPAAVEQASDLCSR